jgi:hypothetical protein
VIPANAAVLTGTVGYKDDKQVYFYNLASQSSSDVSLAYNVFSGQFTGKIKGTMTIDEFNQTRLEINDSIGVNATKHKIGIALQGAVHLNYKGLLDGGLSYEHDWNPKKDTIMGTFGIRF